MNRSGKFHLWPRLSQVLALLVLASHSASAQAHGFERAILQVAASVALVGLVAGLVSAWARWHPLSTLISTSGVLLLTGFLILVIRDGEALASAAGALLLAGSFAVLPLLGAFLVGRLGVVAFRRVLGQTRNDA